MAIGFNDFHEIRLIPAHGSQQAFLCRAALAMALLGAVVPVVAQYPGQLAKSTKNTPTLRAISVLEWTGEEGHPKASRLVPVAVYDGEALQDGGIYLARPEPLSLAGEVEYELERNGKPIGLFDIKNAGQEQGSWVGYGAWKAAPAPKPKAAAPVLPLNPSWNDQDDRPVLHRKAHPDEAPARSGSGDAKTSSPDSSTTGPGASSQPADPDRPTLHKKNPDSGADSASTSATPAPDPDRPTLHKKPQSDDSAASSSPSTSSPSGSASPADAGSGSSSSGPAPDPDRPTLHKKTQSDDSASSDNSSSDRPRLKKKKKDEDESHVDSLREATDPDRPRLKRGQPGGSGLDVLPSLIGLPPDLNQAVAVSDARTATEHQWSFAWADPADEAKMKESLEQTARDALGLKPPPAPAPAPKRTASRKAAKPVAAPPPPPPAPLLDEDFRVYELAYGGGATLVLSAHSGGQGADDKHVTLIAQPDLYGNILVLLKNVTDAAHLDVTPRMRLVDAVDALADNRGELLFELRGQTQRQFALYRVLRGQAEKLFATGPADIVTGVRTND